MTTPLRALVVCPGRGSYSRTEVGYLKRWHSRRRDFIDMADAFRTAEGQPTLRALDDAGRFDAALHSRGDNASALIFACSYADFQALDRAKVDVVAIAGNSMGWYTGLACAGSLTAQDALRVVNTMGKITHDAAPGGQLVHCTVDENWREIEGRRRVLLSAMAELQAQGAAISISIEFGGVIVFAGRDDALEGLAKRTPTGPGNFPFRLVNHGAYHSSLMERASVAAKQSLPQDLFRPPRLPLVDGRGHIWRPYATDPAELWSYTFDAQVLETYDFTTSMRVAAREFAPDCIVALGPGDTLGAAVIQSLIASQWEDLASKEMFLERQRREPLLISMNRPDQRTLVENTVAAA